MRCITLWQPWASLVGVKKHETRSWATTYRGKLGIHAGRRKVDALGRALWIDVGLQVPELELGQLSVIPYGVMVTIANLVNCLEMWDSTVYGPLMPPHRRGIDISTIDALEKSMGDWQEGRFAWELDQFTKLPEPIPASGRQQLWNPELKLLEKINDAIAPVLAPNS